jgi:hypothetical protein
VANGWISQQVLKLMAASISYNTYSMILDAKTIFVRRLDPKTIVDSAGRIQTGIMPLYSVFAPAKKIVDELFDMDLQRQVGPGGVPCIVHNDTVRMMIAEVTLRTKTSFPIWFQSQGVLTEFVLYSAFVQHLCGDIGILYDQHNHLGSIVNVAHNETDSWLIKINQMRKGETLTVSVHRGAWEQLTAPQRQEYRDLLTQRGVQAAADL